jgi:tetratricopeptide (TPR) repeat protein
MLLRPRHSVAWLIGALGVTLLVLGLLAAVPAARSAALLSPLSSSDPLDAAVATAQRHGSPQAQAMAFEQRAHALLARKAYAEALADFEQVLILEPGNVRAYTARAGARVALGQIDQALADYNAAIRHDPRYVPAYLGRVQLLKQRSELQALAADYGRLAQLDPLHSAAYQYARGNALQSLGDLVQARVAYDAALQQEPEHADARYERALVSLAEAKTQQAIADLDHALRLKPRPGAYYARGLAYTALSEYDRARDDFSHAIALKPRYAEALLARAATAYATGDLASAQQDLQRVDQLDLDKSLEEDAERLREQIVAR